MCAGMPPRHFGICGLRPLQAEALVRAIGLWILLGGIALATPGPWSDQPLDPADRLIDRLGRAQGADLLYGARSPGALGLAYRWERVEDPGTPLQTVLAPELLVTQGARSGWSLRPFGRLVIGDGTPALQSGDQEPGLVSVRGAVAAAGYWRGGELLLTPEGRADFVDQSAFSFLPLRTAWGGLHTEHWRVGVGKMDRWFGPGRHGGLMLTDNAAPAPLGSAAWEGRIGERWGRARVELGAGWLDAPRTDVQRPGWLLADLRWAPVPMFEMGATRMGLFGGEGRPAPPLGQLLLPTDPHVEGDQDQTLPDQDEIAALDGRLTLPLGQWLDREGPPGTGLQPDFLELYIQYGGEDVIARKILGIPVPALAGVANLFGAELGMGALVLGVEHARTLDDRFRWYRGHRIYHEGFTQNGQVMGHPEGGDARSTNASVRWFPGEWGVEGSYAHALQVGVAAVEGDHLQALMADTQHQRIGMRGWWLTGERRWMHGGVVVVRTRNPDFLPGAPEWSWRIAIGT